MHLIRPVLFLSFIFLVATMAGWGQTFRGGIAGSVADSSGAAVPDATVKIEQKGTGFTRQVSTTTTGQFTFPDLPPGLYLVTVTKPGFQQQELVNVEVAVGKITSLPITLGVAPVAQTVKVTEAVIQLETNQTALNALVGPRPVQDLPLNGRDFRALLLMTPGFNQSNSMNGNRGTQNNWQYDGADNNDFWHNFEALNQGSVSGFPGVFIPVDSIMEFNQQAGGGADFGRSPGSMVNLVTKSGTNELHGSAYYFHRNEALAWATPFLAPGGSDKLRNHNFGASVGGPIFKNKAFFFVNYEGNRFVEGNPVTATVPSDAWVARAENVLTTFNVPLNPAMVNLFNGVYPARGRNAPATVPNFFSGDNNNSKSDNVVAKIDYRFSDQHNIFVRGFVGTGDAVFFVGSPFREYFQSVPSRQENYSVVLNSVLTPRLVNQVLIGVNYFFQAFDDLNHSANPPALGFNTGVTGSALGTPRIRISGFTSPIVGATDHLGRVDVTGHIMDSLSYSFGSHSLKFGGEYRRAYLDVFYFREARGRFRWTGRAGPWASDPRFSTQEKALADFLAGFLGPATQTISTGNPQRNYYVNSFYGWVHDNWQVSPRLNLSLGLRYDYNGTLYDTRNAISTFIPSFPGGLAIVGQDIDRLYPNKLNNFAPRVGFAFAPKRGGKTVIRANYGIYYDIINGNLFIDNRGAPNAGRGPARNPVGERPIFSVTKNSGMVVLNQPIFGPPAPPFSIWSVSQDLSSPYVQNYSLNVQQELTRGVLFQVGYVGNQGRKLPITLNINQPLPGTGVRPFAARFPQFSGITQLATVANSQYNSLQLSLRSTSWHGLMGQFAYTLGHARDDAGSNYNETGFDSAGTVRNQFVTNNYNIKGDYGNSGFDTRHNISAYLIYDLPFTTGPKRLVQGWSVTALIAHDTGFPFSVIDSDNLSGSGQEVDRADLVGDPFSGVVQPPRGPNGSLVNGVRWFNPAAFKPPAPGTFGTSRRHQFYGPHFTSVDLGVFKTTPITERLKAQIRFEIFNLFNTTNLDMPDSSDGTPDLASGPDAASLITGTRQSGNNPGIGLGEPRNIQVSVKFIW